MILASDTEALYGKGWHTMVQMMCCYKEKSDLMFVL